MDLSQDDLITASSFLGNKMWTSLGIDSIELVASANNSEMEAGMLLGIIDEWSDQDAVALSNQLLEYDWNREAMQYILPLYIDRISRSSPIAALEWIGQVHDEDKRAVLIERVHRRTNQEE